MNNPTDKAPELTLDQRVENLEQSVLVLINQMGRDAEFDLIVQSAIEGGYNALAYTIELLIEHAEQPHTLAEKLRTLLAEGVPTPAPDTVADDLADGLDGT